jgi:hypothetical protein
MPTNGLQIDNNDPNEFWLTHPDVEESVIAALLSLPRDFTGWECPLCEVGFYYVGGGNQVFAIDMDSCCKEYVHVVCALQAGYAVQPYIRDEAYGKHTVVWQERIGLEGAVR